MWPLKLFVQLEVVMMHASGDECVFNFLNGDFDWHYSALKKCTCNEIRLLSKPVDK